MMESSVVVDAASTENGVASWRNGDFPVFTPPVWSWTDASPERERRVSDLCCFFNCFSLTSANYKLFNEFCCYEVQYIKVQTTLYLHVAEVQVSAGYSS